MNVLLSTSYWPNLHYLYYVLNANTVMLEYFENYNKQSYRNRTKILTANGQLELTIPITNKGTKQLISEVEISYQENWQIKHWRAITSAYKNSPYFNFFEEDIYYFYEKPFKFLIDYNLEQLNLILKLLKVKKQLVFTSNFEKTPLNFIDARSVIHPKIDFTIDEEVKLRLKKSYYQTFEDKFDFFPNLSSLDLLFNKGLETLNYLKK